MAIKRYKPTSAARRGMEGYDYSNLEKKRPEKNLTTPRKQKAGRNNNGRITVRFRGGGHKRHFRTVDWKRNKIGVPANVAGIEYDPNRTAHLALLHYVDGSKSYILAPDGLKKGDTVISSRNADVTPGNAMPLKHMPLGTVIHNIELKIGKGSQMVRSAGTAAQLMAKDGDYAQIRLPSGEVRMVHLKCRATVGQVSNSQHAHITLGKAGRTRWLGRRPHNRGVTMNPVDHPMGGGEGRTSGGRHPCSPWGQLAKGKKTRTNKTSNKFIVKKRGKK
ncbi:MAG: 50S ribosomal protein L2 [Deltaproteobacteria bacterium]|nr:MAG: 50S ribosomal protein L2 [Deltaproteobacteria bacterium]